MNSANAQADAAEIDRILASALDIASALAAEFDGTASGLSGVAADSSAAAAHELTSAITQAAVQLSPGGAALRGAAADIEQARRVGAILEVEQMAAALRGSPLSVAQMSNAANAMRTGYSVPMVAKQGGVGTAGGDTTARTIVDAGTGSTANAGVRTADAAGDSGRRGSGAGIAPAVGGRVADGQAAGGRGAESDALDAQSTTATGADSAGQPAGGADAMAAGDNVAHSGDRAPVSETVDDGVGSAALRPASAGLAGTGSGVGGIAGLVGGGSVGGGSGGAGSSRLAGGGSGLPLDALRRASPATTSALGSSPGALGSRAAGGTGGRGMPMGPVGAGAGRDRGTDSHKPASYLQCAENGARALGPLPLAGPPIVGEWDESTGLAEGELPRPDESGDTPDTPQGTILANRLADFFH